MLYIYKNKIHIRPYANKMAEVEIEKKDNDYNIKVVGELVGLDDKEMKKIVPIDIHNAYEYVEKSKGKKRLLKKEEDYSNF